MGSQLNVPDALSLGKIRHSLYRRLGEPQGRSGRVRDIFPPSVFDPRTVQLVESLYRLGYPGPPMLQVYSLQMHMLLT